jgi:hypothetical protein
VKPETHSKICLKNILNHRNRRKNFEDPETIESNWRPLKRLLQGSEKNNLADQCQYYLYQREIRHLNEFLVILEKLVGKILIKILIIMTTNLLEHKLLIFI